MPRIVPLQLLKCLKVLLDDNGGILSIGEVKRIAGLMNRYSKKLVSKCIYVQILKVTKTELLGEFMGVGGWSLVYNWLNDAIRAMNWPLVQEILELLLLCPVDVDRLKINSAPKLVKGLCRDGGNEGVRILAKRLVEQWLKVVTENTSSAQVESVTPHTIVTATATTPAINAVPVGQTTPVIRQEPKVLTTPAETIKVKPTVVVRQPSKNTVEEDPLADVTDTPPEPSTYAPTPAQKKASEAGLVFKLVYKDGQQVLAKVPKSAQVTKVVEEEKEEKEEKSERVRDVIENTDEAEVDANRNVDQDVDVDVEAGADGDADADADAKADADADADADVDAEAEANAEVDAEAEVEPEVETEQEVETETVNHGNEREIKSHARSDVAEEEDTRTSLDKPEKECESSADDETQASAENNKVEPVETPISNRKKSTDADSDKPITKEHKSSKESKEIKNKEKEHKGEKDKDKERKSSSSSSHKSSSHKSKSSSSSKTKSSSSSSSSHRSSSDKHRSEKDRSSSSSSKDKERKEGSSSSSKHKSSSSSSSSVSKSSSSTKEKHRDKDKDKSSSLTTTSHHKKDKDREREREKEKEREKEVQAEKDKETIAKLATPSMDKLGRIPKKPKEESESDVTKPTSITIPSKKASMSIEIRRDSEKAKTVKTYKSQFRSHGLTEEAPPPPSRKGLKKPPSTTSAPGTVIPTSLPSSLKRPSPPPSSSDSPTVKKSKIDINNLTVANEKPGAIKLIPPKKIQTLVETNLFSDALSAATGPKKVTKRKRATTPGPGQNKEGGTSPPTSPDGPKVAPLKFYQDTLDESKSDDKSDKENEHNIKSEDSDAGDKGGNSTEDDDDIPLKKVKEDIEKKVLREQKAADENGKASVDETSTTNGPTANAAGGSVDITGSSDADADAATKDASDKTAEEDEARKPPGPGCGPNGPPGVLMLHRRKGPKKKLTWRPQEHLEQIRYFELDETERCNVTKTQSFMDMKNLERFSERDAINIARRGFTHEDNMRPQTEWRPLIEVDGVPPHPNGNQSKQRKVQAEREQTTLRALYFSHSMIPDSPTEAEIEPHFAYDIPVIPLEDITGNPDAVSDYTNMPWPEPKGSPKYTESTLTSNANKLPNTQQVNALPTANNVNAYPGFIAQYAGTPANNILAAQMQMPRPVPPVGATAAPSGIGQMPQPWQSGNFNGPLAMSGGGMPAVSAVAQQNLLGPFGPAVGNAQWQMHGGQYNATPVSFNNNNAPNNFGPMSLMAPRVMANMTAANAFERNNMNMNSNHHNNNNNNNQNRNNNSGNWRTGSSFQDNSGGGGGGNWRSGGGGGHHRGSGGGGGGNNNNGMCKAFMRGHCRLGKSCKYIHPKSKRI